MLSEPAKRQRTFQDYATPSAAFFLYLIGVTLFIADIADEPRSRTLALGWAVPITTLFVYLHCWLEDAPSISQARTRAVILYSASIIPASLLGYAISAIFSHTTLLGFVPDISIESWLVISTIAMLPVWLFALVMVEAVIRKHAAKI